MSQCMSQTTCNTRTVPDFLRVNENESNHAITIILCCDALCDVVFLIVVACQTLITQDSLAPLNWMRKSTDHYSNRWGFIVVLKTGKQRPHCFYQIRADMLALAGLWMSTIQTGPPKRKCASRWFASKTNMLSVDAQDISSSCEQYAPIARFISIIACFQDPNVWQGLGQSLL